jgi:hypothetical protein
VAVDGIGVAKRRTMSKRFAAAIVSVSLLASCAPKTRAGSGAMLAGGAATVVLGGASLASLKSTGNDTNGNGRDDFPENDIACAIGGCAIAIAILAAGVIMMISGATGLADDAATEQPRLNLAPPAPPFAINARILPPLPTLQCDAETLRLAQQARALAQLGHCEAAQKLAVLLNARDSEYAAALAGSTALYPCPV